MAKTYDDALAEALKAAKAARKCRDCGAPLLSFFDDDPRWEGRYGRMALECRDRCDAQHNRMMDHLRAGVRF